MKTADFTTIEKTKDGYNVVFKIDMDFDTITNDGSEVEMEIATKELELFIEGQLKLLVGYYEIERELDALKEKLI